MAHFRRNGARRQAPKPPRTTSPPADSAGAADSLALGEVIEFDGGLQSGFRERGIGNSVSAYQEAVRELGPATPAWDSTRKHLLVRRDDVYRSYAETVVENIESESHLCGSSSAPDAKYFASILGNLSQQTWQAEDEEVAKTYHECTSKHSCKGRRLQTRPKRVFRFLDGIKFFNSIRKVLQRVGALTASEDLRGLILKARSGAGNWDDVRDYVVDPAIWALVANETLLAERPVQFVTFDREGADGDIARATAVEIFERLGPAQDQECPPCYLRVSYSTKERDELRFPTFLDAGWSRSFRGAAPDAPHGWTVPRGQADGAPLPEAVDSPQPLARVDAAETDFCVCI
ncbi:MAG TPA: hypothetical protein VGK73_19505 [Polyangiaceae bacterium]